MNQEQNNLNPNNFNTQGNNGIPNNQPLNNQSFNQGMSINQQPVNPQPQPAPSYEQPMNQVNIGQPTSQPMNTFESDNINNQNFNSKPPKKMNLGLITGIVAAIIVVLVPIIFVKNNINKNDDNKVNDSSINEQYLDISRNLKSEYEYKKIFDSYAIRLNNKTTYIVKPNKNYLVNLLQFSQGFVSRMAGFYKTDDGIWGAYFNISLLNESNFSEVKDSIISSGYYNIIDENSNYILSSNGQDYAYNTIIDETMIEVTLSSTTDNYFEKEKLNKEDIISIIKNIKSIIKEDDLKEPYLVDKIINSKLNNNYKIKTYLTIGDVNNDIINNTNYNVGLSISDDNGDFYVLDIYYSTEKTINNYSLINKVNDNPKVYYDKNNDVFIFEEKNNKNIFKISKSDIDGKDIDIKTYDDFKSNIKVFLEQN